MARRYEGGGHRDSERHLPPKVESLSDWISQKWIECSVID